MVFQFLFWLTPIVYPVSVLPDWARGLIGLFYAIGMIQRDGVSILLGHAAQVATIAYFGVLLGGGGLAVRELVERITG